MIRVIPAALLSLVTALAFAVDEDPPIESNMTAVIIFFGICVVAVALYIWHTIKNERVSKEQKEGEKF